MCPGVTHPSGLIARYKIIPIIVTFHTKFVKSLFIWINHPIAERVTVRFSIQFITITLIHVALLV